MTGPLGRPPPPFAPGSVSIRLYPHNDLDAEAVVAELCTQARLALVGGFDGVMTSEHHGGFAGYLPNPLQMAAFFLEEHPGGWAAPCPLVLPLRPAALVAEEVAWLDARHPGRVGLGVAAGALPLDFTAMGLRVADAVPRFVAELPRIVGMLAGRDLGELHGDPALQRCSTWPIPVLSAAASPSAARRAASCGAGILLEGMSPPERLRAVCSAYDRAGGTRPKVLIRRTWLGHPDPALVARQRSVYESYAPGSRAPDQTISADGPAELAELLAEAQSEAGADALNLRVHLPGIAPGAIGEQIAALAADVVPRLRVLLAARIHDGA